MEYIAISLRPYTQNGGHKVDFILWRVDTMHQLTEQLDEKNAPLL
ncbi:hypothetical protein [Nostoc sp. DedQUE07]|nr:hypothetical protein [Nostoc sp. DedQUE07]MDZ8128152.1 hypothetical protein [Nostoc sp. DedQUE07]